MPRFQGLPVEADASPTSASPRRQRFAGTRVETKQEGTAYAPDSFGGSVRTALGGVIEGIPVVGPYIRDGADRASAGVRAAFTDDTFDEAYGRITRQNEAEKKANPWIDTAAQVVGGIAGSAPLVAAAPGAFGIGATTTLRGAGAGLVSGGALGAADGAVRGGSEGALIGGGLGGALGAAGPVVGNVVGKGVAAVQSARANSAAAKAAGLSPASIESVRRGLHADLSIPGANGIADAGPAAMVADAGPATRSMLDAAIARAGPGAGDAARRIETRAAAAASDVDATLTKGLGQPEGAFTTISRIRDASQPARGAAYDAAYATPIDYSLPQARDLEGMLTRVPQSIIDRANNLMRVNGEKSQQIMAVIGDDGSVVYKTLPDVRQIDYITRALNDVAKGGDGKGALGGNTAEGRAYKGLSDALRNVTRSMVPQYGTALETAAEPIAMREAVQYGQQLLRPSTPRDEAAAFIGGLSDPELQSLKGGVRSTIAETLANVRRTITDPNVDVRQGIQAIKDLSSDAAREKIAMVVGPDEAGAMFRALDEAARSMDMRASVATNSRTFGRQAAQQAVEEATAPSVIENAVGGAPVRTVQGFLQGATGTAPADRLARQDAVWGEIADLLTRPASEGRGALLSTLQDAARRGAAIPRQADFARGVVNGGLAALIGPANTLLAEPRR